MSNRVSVQPTFTLHRYDVVLDGVVVFRGLIADGALSARDIARRTWCEALAGHLHVVPRWLRALREHNIRSRQEHEPDDIPA